MIKRFFRFTSTIVVVNEELSIEEGLNKLNIKYNLLVTDLINLQKQILDLENKIYFINMQFFLYITSNWLFADRNKVLLHVQRKMQVKKRSRWWFICRDGPI